MLLERKRRRLGILVFNATFNNISEGECAFIVTMIAVLHVTVTVGFSTISNTHTLNEC
jgi:hypothetical protein